MAVQKMLYLTLGTPVDITLHGSGIPVDIILIQ